MIESMDRHFEKKHHKSTLQEFQELNNLMDGKYTTVIA